MSEQVFGANPTTPVPGVRSGYQTWTVPHRDSGVRGTNPHGLTAQELEARLGAARGAGRRGLDAMIGSPAAAARAAESRRPRPTPFNPPPVAVPAEVRRG